MPSMDLLYMTSLNRQNPDCPRWYVSLSGRNNHSIANNHLSLENGSSYCHVDGVSALVQKGHQNVPCTALGQGLGSFVRNISELIDCTENCRSCFLADQRCPLITRNRSRETFARSATLRCVILSAKHGLLEIKVCTRLIIVKIIINLLLCKEKTTLFSLTTLGITP